MPFSRPFREGTSRTLLLVLLCVSLHGTAAAINVQGGNLIIMDARSDPLGYGDHRGAIMLGDEKYPVPIRLIASPSGIVNGQQALALDDGTILVVDSDADLVGDGGNRGALWSIDPQAPLPGQAVVYASSLNWVTPTAILEEPSGNILVLDADSDVRGDGTYSGALFRVDATSRTVVRIASSNFWVDPRSMVFDRDGSILVWDPHADPLNLGGPPGALFRVDPTYGSVSIVFSIRGFTNPWAVALDRNGDYLILDRDANPGGYPGAPGCVYRVRRNGLALQPIIDPPQFVEPVAFTVDANGDVWVADRAANPLHYPNESGVIFHCDPTTGQIKNTLYSGFFTQLSGITVVSGTSLDSSLVRWDDQNGPPLQPGDRMRVRVTIRNTGLDPANPVRMEHTVSALWDYVVGSDSTSYGDFSYDPSTKVVRWVGDVPPQGEAQVSYEIRLHNDASEGIPVHEAVLLRVGRSVVLFPLEGTVARRSDPGRVVWSDYEPVNGQRQGVIWEMPAGAVRPVRVFSGPPLVQPGALTFLPDGRIAVLDRFSLPRGPGARAGGIFVIDPYNGHVDTLLAVADHPELKVPLGLSYGRVGELLLVDKDANPLGYPGQPGAVYSVSVATGTLHLISEKAYYSEPFSAILESTGHILMADIDADPGGQNPHGGAVFDINPSNGQVTWLNVPPGNFVDPIALAEAPNRRIYVADISADPLHIGRNTGAIFVVVRGTNDQLLLASADSLYSDPDGVFPQQDGTLIVTDRTADPYHRPPRDWGTIFRVRPFDGSPQIVTSDPSLHGPQAVAGYQEGSLATSRMDVVDVNGPPTVSGDTLRFEAMVLNTGRAPIPEAMATITLTPGVDFLSGTGPPGTIVDPAIRTVTWLGGVTPPDTMRLEAVARVQAGHEFGDVISGVLQVSGPGAPPADSIKVRVVALLGTGDMVLSDADADPQGDGQGRGGLFRLRSDLTRAGQLLAADTSWTDPSAVLGFDPGRVLIADIRGGNPGRIDLVDYLRATSTPYIDDARLGGPCGLLRNHLGDLIVVDPRGRLVPNGPARPILFIRHSGQNDFAVLSADSLMRQPGQATEDDQGRLWVVDRLAHPNGSLPGRGAIFRIDPATGAVIDTLEFPDLVSPTGIVSWAGQGFLVVDGAAEPPGTGRGAVFQIDPDARTCQVRVVDPRFRFPYRATFAPSGELWIIDKLARDETQIGSPRTLFRWDPETGRVDAVGASSSYVNPTDLYALPGPDPSIVTYWIEDPNGPPVSQGDEIVIHATIANTGPLATLSATYADTLPLSMLIERATIHVDAGVAQSPQTLNGLNWTVDLPPGASYSVSYQARVRPIVPQGLLVTLRSHLRTSEGVHRVRRIRTRYPVYFQDGYLYVADPTADPYGLGGSHGAVLKVDMSQGSMTPMGSTTDLSRPVSTVSVPADTTRLLVVDMDANPNGYPSGSGCLWRWLPATGGFALAAADSTFRSPRAAVALDGHQVLLLDSVARPQGPNRGLGAVYHVDLTTGQATPFLTDSLLVSPRDIVLDGHGGAFVIDADSDPGHFGMRNGAVFRIDLLTQKLSVYAISADWRGPVAGAMGNDGLLYVLDAEAITAPGSPARGAIYRVDGNGNVTLYASSQAFRRPVDLQIDPLGRIYVTDPDADPYHAGAGHGAIFVRDGVSGSFRPLAGGPRFGAPSGFFARAQVTPVELTELAASPLDQGLRITWKVPDAQFNGFLCMRAPGTNPSDQDYVTLNPDQPVPGGGPWKYDDATPEAGEVYSYRIACLLPGGGVHLYGPVVATAPLWRAFALLPPVPNPTQGTATFRFDLPRAGTTALKLYDVSGRRVRRLASGPMPAGRHEIVWNGRDDSGHRSPSGIYVARLEWSGRSATRRLTLLR